MKLANLPTDLGMRLIGSTVKPRLLNPVHVKEAVCAFQRMALVAELDESVMAMETWLKPSYAMWTKQDNVQLEMCHRLVKKDVLGLAIETLVDIATKGTSNKDRLAASTIINELYGDKELIDTGSLADKLLVNIVRGA